MPQSKITATLEKYGNLELVEFDYLRFKSNSNGESKTKKFIQEQLYTCLSLTFLKIKHLDQILF